MDHHSCCTNAALWRSKGTAAHAAACSRCSLAPAVGDVCHQAIGWQGHGAGHNAAVGADDVAQLAADLLAEVVTDLRSAAVGHHTGLI